MKTNDNRDWETAQAVLERAARAALDRASEDRASEDRASEDRGSTEVAFTDGAPVESEARSMSRREEPLWTCRGRRKVRRRVPYEFEPLPLITPTAWQGTDFMTLGIGAVLIVGMFVAVACGISWVILPGAAALIFAMISTQLRWERMSLIRRLQWQRARRMAARSSNSNGRRGNDGTGTRVTGIGDAGTGGIVQLPGQRRRRTG